MYYQNEYNEIKRKELEAMRLEIEKEMAEEMRKAKILDRFIYSVFALMIVTSVYGLYNSIFHFKTTTVSTVSKTSEITPPILVSENQPSPFADRVKLANQLRYSQNMITESERMTTKRIKVMIVDTEINVKHPFLEKFFDPSLEGRKRYVYDHGTHVSGIIAQRLFEVFGKDAWNYVEFIPCQFYGTDKDNNYLKNSGLDAEIICLKEALAKKVDFINFSANGTEYSKEEVRLIRSLEKIGTTIVVSSGNQRGSSLNSFPCNVKSNNLVCVGSVDAYNKRSSFSNDGPNVHYVAFGANEFSSLGIDSEGFMTGTSQAAPQVTALLVAQKITMSAKVSQTIMNHGIITKREPVSEFKNNRMIASVKK